MPRVAPRPPVDQTTATGQAVARARAVASKRGTPPTGLAPEEAAGGGLDEFAPGTTSNPLMTNVAQQEQAAAEQDAFDGDSSQAFTGAEAPPAAKKAVAKKAPAKKVAAKRAGGAAVVAASDAWFADLDETEDFVNILWYGAEGSTKTTSMATAANIAPEGSRVLIVNAEGGLKVRALRKRGVDTSKIVVFPNPESGDELTDETLERIFLRVQKDLMDNPKSWFAVGFDSVTEVGQILVDQAQSVRTQRLLSGSNAANVDTNFVDRDDYGVAAKIIRKQLRRWRDLPCHFLATALMRRDVDEDTNAVKYGPAVSPAVANDLMGYVDIAIMLKGADGALPIRGLTAPNDRYRAKDRFDVLPKVMAIPTFDRVLEYVTEQTIEADDAFQYDLLPSNKAKASDTVDSTDEDI